MFAALFLYVCVGLGLFYLQQLVLYPHVTLRPLAPLLFFVSLKEPLAPAFGLACFLGLLQDSYGLPPLGIHLGNALMILGMARLARERLWIKSGPFLVLAMAVILLIQEMGARLLLALVESSEVLLLQPSWPVALEIGVTALVTPVFFNVFRTLEVQWRRLRKAGSADSP